MTGLTSPTHLIIILLLALLLFGAKRLPEIGRSLGVGMREFKDSVTGVGADHSEPPQQIAQQPIVTQDTAAPAPQRESETVN